MSESRLATQYMVSLPFQLSRQSLVKKRPSHCETPGRDLLRQLIKKREDNKRHKDESLHRLHENCHNAQLEVSDFNDDDAEKICEQVFNHAKQAPDSKQEVHR